MLLRAEGAMQIRGQGCKGGERGRTVMRLDKGEIEAMKRRLRMEIFAAADAFRTLPQSWPTHTCGDTGKWLFIQWAILPPVPVHGWQDQEGEGGETRHRRPNSGGKGEIQLDFYFSSAPLAVGRSRYQMQIQLQLPSPRRTTSAVEKGAKK